MDLEPHGLELHVQVVEARGFPTRGVSANAYFRLQVHSHDESTPVVANTLNPAWDRRFTFPLRSYASAALHITAIDKQPNGDEVNGWVEVVIAALPRGEIVDAWYSIRPAVEVIRRGVSEGSVRLQLLVIPAGTKCFEPLPWTAREMVVTVHEARGVPRAGKSAAGDSYCVVALVNAGVSRRSSVAKKSSEPVWNTTVRFLLTDVEVDAVEVTVFLDDLIAPRAVGKLVISAASVGEGWANRWLPLVQPKATEKPCELRVTAAMDDAPSISVTDKAPGERSPAEHSRAVALLQSAYSGKPVERRERLVRGPPDPHGMRVISSTASVLGAESTDL